jgi:hypothetical protein
MQSLLQEGAVLGVKRITLVFGKKTRRIPRRGILLSLGLALLVSLGTMPARPPIVFFAKNSLKREIQ